MSDVYEVTLVLEENINDVHNPIFVFEDGYKAMEILQIFAEQGYKVLLNIVDEKDGR